MKSNDRPCSANETHPTSWTPVRLPPIVVPPAARGKEKATHNSGGGDKDDIPQLTKLPRHRGPIFAVPCKICGKETRIARSEVIPLCEDCMVNVVPKSVAHTIVLNDTVGTSEFDLELVLQQLEFDYLNEVSRRLV